MHKSNAVHQLLTLASALALATTASAQAIYVPGGTVGNNTTNNNVGIGTAVPGYKFDLRTPGSNSTQLHVASTDTDAGGYVVSASNHNIYVSGGVAYNGSAWIAKGTSYGLFGSHDGVINFFTGTGTTAGNAVTLTERMKIDPTGNVGIGTSAPGVRLEVQSSDSLVPLVLRNTSASGYVGFNAFDSSPSLSMSLAYSNASATVFPKCVWLANRGTVTGNDLVFATNNLAERMRITNAGNIGIGIITPSASVDIWKAYSAGTDSLRFSYNDGTAYWMGIQPYAVGAGNVGYKFRTNNGSTTVEALAITGNGNVGIGTSNPTQKLAVNGTIRAKEIVVDTGWSDYVFDDDYRLAPLSEVESHIKAHKHLPGIPSAAEVETGGVRLGDMQSKLLAKIEELTLHLIVQEKQLGAQADRIAQLERVNTALRNH